MPDGRRKEETIDRPENIELMAHRIINAGFVFEIEMLQTGIISMEICHPKTERSLAGALCPNGPTNGDQLGVPESVDKMIKKAFAKIPKKFREMKVEMPKVTSIFDGVDLDEPFIISNRPL